LLSRALAVLRNLQISMGFSQGDKRIFLFALAL
jgi:hypothetical protein